MSLWGSIIGAGAGILGGFLDRKSAKDDYKRQRNDAIQDQINKLPRLRESAEKAGFNPLTALMATGGGGFGQTGVAMQAAPLSSAAILTNAVTGIADAWTSKQADDANRVKAEAEIWRRQVEKERAGGAGETVRRTMRTAGVADLGSRPAQAAPVSTRAATGMGPFGLWNVMPANPSGPTVELKMPESVTREHLGPLWQSVTRKDGTILEHPVLADPEEIAAGYIGAYGPETYEKLKPLAWGMRQMIMPSLNAQGRQGLQDGITGLKQWYDRKVSPAKQKVMDDYRQGIPSWMRN